MLKVPRSSFYYKHAEKQVDTVFENAVIFEFKKSKNNYGTRKIRIMLRRKCKEHPAIFASRKRIGKVMKKYNLISNYTISDVRMHE